MDDEYLTVSQVNAYINKMLKSDVNLRNIYIRGEISNYKTYPSGHSYFTLKDEKSQIPAVMFKGRKHGLKFKPENGMKVIIKGKIEVYERDGKYQLYANSMTEDGIGDLHIAFEQLKKKLAGEGLFDSAHKKEIPKYPQKIGVVTARTGAAIRDIITTIKRRYPYCEVLVFSTLVQGDMAAPQIVRQIRHAQQYDIDTLIVGRGGGSIEDLWPFNEEIVAREIYACEIPVISAVGHEIDYTISDFVADKRAPTPTGAAVIAVPDINEVKYKVSQLNQRINKSINDRLIQNKEKIDNISQKQIFKNPESIYEIKEMHLDNLIGKLNVTSKNIISENRNKLIKIESRSVLRNPEEVTKAKREQFLRNVDKLKILDPLLTLKRGYSIVKIDDKVISSAKDVKSGDELNIEFDDGTINTKVI
ncbi:exodeoxyribonuclease VII large subunit [Methanobrevibacter sp.]|uniref:exodeoxyribonuclease VII large subunit n=1 Tax=Methanobrevibacter sp. TaxID=66852 RepID=UPI0038695C1F